VLRWLHPFWRSPGRGGPGLDVLLEPGFVAVDLETTGLDPRRDAVVAAAAIPVRGGVPAPGFVTLVDPGRPIPASSSAIHGITDAMVAGAPAITAVLDALARMWAGAIVVGHGLAFDLAVLRREARARGRRLPEIPTVCTMQLAAALYPDWSDVTLDAVAGRLGVVVRDRHTAQGDAEAAAAILLGLLPALRARGVRTLAELLWLQASARPGR
jgi:DNA polymerase III epsilon subunit family exonuclease